MEQAHNEGIYVLITDGYLSYAEQDALYAQGRTKPGEIFTNANGGQSKHNFGIVVDYCLTNKEGTTHTGLLIHNGNELHLLLKARDLNG
ncbi:M15 family metallopeptidase [Bacillus sp. Au-Bac7]|uniref:M15 family metallopeptidase n=1 Tax=Bacillus sp. Au-Bac7 TaxID=2906458 RepID=UPI003FA3CC18